MAGHGRLSEISASSHMCLVNPIGIHRLNPPKNTKKSIKEHIHDFITISDKVPSTLQYFRSNLEIQNERERHYNSRYCYIIHPFSKFRASYEMYLIFLYGSLLIAKPIDISYIPVDEVVSHDFWKHFWFILDVLSLLDIIATFFCGYTLNQTKHIVLEPSKIALNYIKSPFFFCDLVSSVPKHVLCSLDVWCDQSVNQAICVLQIFKFVRIHTLYVLFYKASDNFLVKSKVPFFVIFSLIIIFVITHWLACAHFFIPRFRFWVTGHYDKNSWIIINNLLDAPMQTKYIRGVYRSSSYSLCVFVLFDQILLWDEYVLVTFNIIVGKIVTVVIWVILLAAIMSGKSSEIEYQEFLAELREYMHQKQIPLNMRNRLHQYYRYKYQQKYFKESLIKQLLSANLKKEINTHVCKQLISNVSLFSDLNPTLVANILVYLVPEIYLTHDVIIRAGTKGDAMYFLSSGTVSVCTQSGKEICHLQDGAYFGEISLIVKNHKRNATITAIEICEVYRLDRKHFDNIFVRHRKLYKKIVKAAEERLIATSIIEDDYKKELFRKTFEGINLTTS